MVDRGKRPILGIGINVIDYDGAVSRIVAAAEAGRPLAVSALAVHGVMTGVLDRAHRFRLNAIDLVLPDGQPVRWALRLLHGERLPDRVCGRPLMEKVCAAAAQRRIPVFLYGSSATVIDALEANLNRDYPGLVIAGTSPSRFRQVDDITNDAIITSIRESGARIVFVGLGCPRQEVFAFENAAGLSCPALAVGAAFDFLAGNLKSAPMWMQDMGLEWLFRLGCEPTRLWRRYIILNPLFCWNVALQWGWPQRFAATADQAPEGRQNYA